MTEVNPPAAPAADTGQSATPGQPAAAAPSPEASGAPPSPQVTPSPSPSGGDISPTPAPAPAPAASKDGDTPPAFKLPDEWKDKPWASKIKSEADLYKQLDHLNTAVGKKMVVPDLDNASDAEREEYFKLTRPANGIEAYQFGDSIDPDLKKGMGESLLKHGVSAHVANNIIKDYQAGEAKLLAAQYDPETIKTTMEASFGKDWEVVTGATRNALSKVMSPEDNALMDNLPNAYISLIYKTFGNVLKAVEKVRGDYGIKESAAHILAGSAPAAPLDVNAQRAALRGELGKLSSRPHTTAEKQAIINKINDTYKDDPRIVRKA